MLAKKTHYTTGLIIIAFVSFHLLNHMWSICGAESHIAFMHTFRLFYRNPICETVLLLAVLVQIISGLKLLNSKRKTAVSFFDKLQIWTGFYLAIFFGIHLSAVLGGRYLLHLDTNFYFGVAGLNTFPFNLFFIPYYGLAIICFFGHLAAVHNKKMRSSVLGINPQKQAYVIIAIGVLLTLFIFFGLTNHFHGVIIPEEYKVLVGGK
jgi:hypothetical protein